MTRDKAIARNSIRRSSSVSRYRRQSIDVSVKSHDSLSSDISYNNNEIYAGAGSEIIPSSITSFHYPHSLGYTSRPSFSDLRSPFLVAGVGNGVENLELGSMKSNDSTNSNEETNFRFFKLEEIQQAPGGSTYENAEEDVDYNTDWEYPKYTLDVQYPEGTTEWEDQSVEERDLEDQINYGGLNFQSRRRSSETSSHQDLLSDQQDYDNEEEFNCVAKYQRYYLAEEDLVIGIAGYANNPLKQVLYYLLCISTLGMGYLILRWIPRYRINLFGDSCALGKANWCVIENEYGELTLVDISKTRFNQRLSHIFNSLDLKDEKDPILPSLHTFEYRYIKFYYHPIEDIFKTNGNWYDIHWLHAQKIQEGLSQGLYEDRKQIFSSNLIDIDDKSVWKLLIEEVLHPFYVFQIFSIVLWLLDEYYYYASCIFIISMISIVNTLIETKSTISRLREISKFNGEVRVWRNEFWKTVNLDDLVPGDIFELDPSLNIMPCDALLINGDVIVNESMLTGESVPVNKTEVQEDELLHIKDNINVQLAKSFLYNGTKILKRKSGNDEPVKALVVKTGFNTTKGSLIRSMLFPRPIGFKFYQDSFKYIGFMTGISVIGFIYSTLNFIKLGLPVPLIIMRALDIITIVVPPALPATLTIGTTFAINRLKSHQIFCIAPTRVNIGGKIDVICFDKTGTLTEDGLDVLGVHLVNTAKGRKHREFEKLSRSVEDINIRLDNEQHSSNNGPNLITLITTCHSLRNIDNEILGDPLDLKMFEFSNSKLYETDVVEILNDFGRYKISKEFEFDSNLRRMSVLVSTSDANMIYTKGAPEVMMNICNPDTIPANFYDLLYDYTNNGYRVIACGCKKVDTLQYEREGYESDLEFLGFIIFENKLKPNSTSTIGQLTKANIRTIMCTGDNILTAISVGKECGILNKEDKVYVPRFSQNPEIEELVWEDIDDSSKILDSRTLTPAVAHEKFKLAITGELFKVILTNHKEDLSFMKFLLNCSIFARMSPDEKHELVNQLQSVNYTVGFIGDGANDCGALKAADVGVSLSEAEASIAAPFTSRVFEISCLLDIIKEGRSSLVTSFSSFKFMSLYSAIQFISVSILYKEGTNLGDFQFLYIDLVLILPLAIFMSWAKPGDTIIKKRPTANLVNFKILVNLIGDILIILGFQIFLWKMIQFESWYVKPVPGDDDNVKSFDNTVLFLVTNFQYIIISMLLNDGKPYRQLMIHNTPYLVTLSALGLLSVGLFFIRENTFAGDLMQLVDLPSKYYWYILLMSVLNYCVLYGCNEFVFKWCSGIYRRYNARQSKKLYKNYLREFRI